MTVQRKDPSTIYGLPPDEIERFLDGDVLIRSGMCPNKHGLMAVEDGLQRCPVCGFFTNAKAELTRQ